MDYYSYYSEREFEPFEDSSKSTEKSKKKKKFWKKVKKFFVKLRDKVIDAAISTMSQMALRFFDKKMEKAFA